ncbi:hypothetical protein A2Y83_04270 [Candidatus Falkowbacteria bacterium RBG_13_39_14]|uniref:Addiction module toxin, HicA family n=1 Tax=Candidatus Falkowbacteria bacterium RBG_13_39_14 TaxID=1797985 RepID=A0A1F5S768_9BACT|nr:MAG: hypothetical protein A2Y83_04270 [Candidatus Falkowbacteria bacterium RBG_13_39_14]
MGEKLPVFSSKEFIRVALQLGFQIKKGGKGSHTRLIHPQYKIVFTIPKVDTLSIGIRHGVLKDLEKIGINYEKFIKLLSVGFLIFIKNLFFGLFR